ncbi:hypothetical protein SAY87_012361 [Trapa incisa]|uniref:Uncharacterized protein n=1 Tax=Trapa incisa TaxID=236973 RepID=A0AAN7JIU2_9MYRT|nr:hypothetical protein SAY87_012361 [Trapa incisa]
MKACGQCMKMFGEESKLTHVLKHKGWVDIMAWVVCIVPSPLSSALNVKTSYLSNEERINVQTIKENALKITSSLSWQCSFPENVTLYT